MAIIDFIEDFPDKLMNFRLFKKRNKRKKIKQERINMAFKDMVGKTITPTPQKQVKQSKKDFQPMKVPEEEVVQPKVQETQPIQPPVQTTPPPVEDVPQEPDIPQEELEQEEIEAPYPPEQDMTQEEYMLNYRIVLRRLKDKEEQIRTGKIKEKDELRLGSLKTENEMLNECEILQLKLEQYEEVLKNFLKPEQIQFIKENSLNGQKGYTFGT